jgi:pSer/pThr/pTyr-binding forkhead associated (FHA) protein
MADPENENKNEAKPAPSAPQGARTGADPEQGNADPNPQDSEGQASDNNPGSEEGKPSIQTASSKTPTAEATKHLADLLVSVADAGLGEIDIDKMRAEQEAADLAETDSKAPEPEAASSNSSSGIFAAVVSASEILESMNAKSEPKPEIIDKDIFEQLSQNKKSTDLDWVPPSLSETVESILEQSKSYPTEFLEASASSAASQAMDGSDQESLVTAIAESEKILESSQEHAASADEQTANQQEAMTDTDSELSPVSQFEQPPAPIQSVQDDEEEPFYQSSDVKFNLEQSIQDVIDGTDPAAINTLQELFVSKALMDLQEAEHTGDQELQMQSLISLALMEKKSAAARKTLSGSTEQEYDLDPHPLADLARHAAVDLSNDTLEPAKYAYGRFLSREIDRAPRDERHKKRVEAINELSYAAEQRLRLIATDDFSLLIRNLQAIDAVLTAGETNNPEIALAQIHNLLRLKEQQANPTAQSYLEQIEKTLRSIPGAMNISRIIRDLEARGTSAKDALRVFQKSLPDVYTELNSCRVDQIMQGLGANTSAEQLSIASALLEDELKFGNADALAQLQWTSTGESCQKITEALHARDLEDLDSVKSAADVVRVEMDKLTRISRTGNDTARSALLGILLVGTSEKIKQAWQMEQQRAPLVPDLHDLSPAEVSIVREHAALALQDTIKRNPDNLLSLHDCTAISFALAESFTSADRNVQKAIEAIFDAGFSARSRANLIDGLINALGSELPGCGRLSEQLIRAYNDGLSNTQRFNLGRLAQQNVEGAVRTLAMIAANSPQASGAAQELEKTGAVPRHRDKLLHLLLDEYKNNGDSGCLLATIGQIAARDNPPSSTVIDKLRQAFETHWQNTDMSKSRSAARGLLALSSHWRMPEIKSFCKHLNQPELIAEIPEIANSLSEKIRNYFIGRQHEALTKGSGDERLAAAQALRALAQFLPAEIAEDLGFFLTVRGKQELQKVGLADKMSLFVKEASMALLSMLGSNDHIARAAALEVFPSDENLPSFISDKQLPRIISEFLEGKRSEIKETDECVRILYDANLAFPCPGIFSKMGITAARISSEQYRALSNAATLNILSREQRIAIGATPGNFELSELALQLDKGSLNFGLAENSLLSINLNKALTQLEHETENSIFQLSSAMHSTEELRNKAIKDLQELYKAPAWSQNPFSDKRNMNSEDLVLIGEKIARFDEHAADFQDSLNKTIRDLELVKLAQKILRHFSLSMNSQKTADILLLKLIAQHGRITLERSAPANFAEANSAFLRLKAAGLINTGSLPDYSDAGFKKALLNLPAIQLKLQNIEPVDAPALETLAFEQIELVPVFEKIGNGAAMIAERLPLLQQICGMELQQHPQLLARVRVHISKIEQVFSQVKLSDLRNARDAVAQMKNTFQDIEDSDVARHLHERIKAYEAAFELFGGNLNTRLREFFKESISGDYDDASKRDFLALGNALAIASSVVASTLSLHKLRTEYSEKSPAEPAQTEGFSWGALASRSDGTGREGKRSSKIAFDNEHNENSEFDRGTPTHTRQNIEALLHSLPELNQAAVAEFSRRIQQLCQAWQEDLQPYDDRLCDLEAELKDAELVLETGRREFRSNRQNILQCRKELSVQKRWQKKNTEEQDEWVEKKLYDKLDQLERNADNPLGRNKFNWNQLRQEQNNLKRYVETALDNRLFELQKELDIMHDNCRWPQISAILSSCNARGPCSYQFGAAELYISKELLLKADERQLRMRILHEIVHTLQDRLLSAYSIYKEDNDLSQARNFYQDLTGFPLAESVVQDAHLHFSLGLWTRTIENRAVELARSLRERPANLASSSRQLYRRLRFIKGRLHSLARDRDGTALHCLFGHFDFPDYGQEFQSELFAHGLPPVVQTIFEQWKADVHSSEPFTGGEVALQKIYASLKSEFNSAEQEYETLIKNCHDRLEEEVSPTQSDKFFEEPVKVATVSSNSLGVTPFEALRALNAASSRKGDSLHPDSPGWEQTRKMYDSKLQEGFMTAAEAKRLLQLPPIERAFVESMLRRDKIDKESLAALLELEPRTISQLGTLPPKLFFRILLPALQRGLINGPRVNQIFSLQESQRQLVFDLIQKAAADPGRSFTGDHIEAFLSLPLSSRTEFFMTLTPNAGLPALRMSEAALTLAVPVRSFAGRVQNDASILARSLQKQIISADQVADFGSLDESARAGISNLLASNSLTTEMAKTIFDGLFSGNLSGGNIKDLSLGRSFGWFPQNWLNQIFEFDQALRNALFDRLAIETPGAKPGSFSLDEFMKRMEPLEQMRKQGIINEPLLRLLAIPHYSDYIVFDLLNRQLEKAAAERLLPESILQLLRLSRNGKVPLDTLAVYKYTIEKKLLDRYTFRSLMLQKAEHRLAAESLLKLAPERFSEFIRSNSFAEIPEQLGSLKNPLIELCADVINGFELQTPTNKLEKEQEQELLELARHLAHDDYKAFFGLLQNASDNYADGSERPALQFLEKSIELHQLYNEQALKDLLSQLSDGAGEEGESSEQLINICDPLIEIVEEFKFHLLDSSMVLEEERWKESNPLQKAFIESVQNSTAGRTVIRKIALQLLQDWSEQTTGSREQALKYLRRIESTQEAKAEKPAPAKIIETEEIPTGDGKKEAPLNIRKLLPGNFSAILKAKAEIEFPNGLKAEIQISTKQFKKIEKAYNAFLRQLRRASKLEGEEKDMAMEDIAAIFDQVYAPVLQAAGVKVSISNQSFMRLHYADVSLEENYVPPNASAGFEPINLNLQQGIRRLLLEQVDGKRLYRELVSIRNSGITPKFDPSPPDGRVARINNADRRELSKQQRSAVATVILHNNTGSLEGALKLPEGSYLKAVPEMSVYKAGGAISHVRAAFDRAEEWSHLMYCLNNNSPLSKGGRAVAELYDRGELSDLRYGKGIMVLKNDFIQIMRELDIKPDESLFDSHGNRKEIDERLARECLFFEKEIVLYNDEPYRIVARNEQSKQVLIKYEAEAREAISSKASFVTDEELSENFNQVHPDNKIHYKSNNPNDKNIFILSISDKGKKILHTDYKLRCVMNEQLQSELERGWNPQDPQKKLQERDLIAAVRNFFDYRKEYSVGVNETSLPLTDTVIVGVGSDGEIKLAHKKETIDFVCLQIIKTDDGILIQDLNSRLGTYVNFKRLKPYETVPIKAAERITLAAQDGPELQLFLKPQGGFAAPDFVVGMQVLKPGDTLTIGRLPSTDAFVSDPSISKLHATLRMTRDRRVYIKDGGSHGPSDTGLVVNGEHVIPGSEIELKAGEKVFNRKGIELPIYYEEKSRYLFKEGSNWLEPSEALSHLQKGRFIITESASTDSHMFMGVDPAKGLFALPESRKELQSLLRYMSAQGAESAAAQPKGKAEKLRLKVDSAKSDEDDDLSVSLEQRLTQKVLGAQGGISEDAAAQSNAHAGDGSISAFLLDGFSNAGRGIYFELDGYFPANNRIATSVDREQDYVLQRIIYDARRRFSHFPPDERAGELMFYVNELLTPKDMSADQLDKWYDQFSQDYGGRRILLGEFIRQGKGISTQQAMLLKVLSDDFGDMICTLVRGMEASHSWTTFMIDGREIIHDPRAKFISPLANQADALKQAKFWIPDALTEAPKLPKHSSFSPGAVVSYDGTNCWTVISFDSKADELIIAADATRSVSSADIAVVNPGRFLRAGERYNLPRPDGALDRAHDAWTFESINKDGSLRFVRKLAIRARVKPEQVRLRKPAKN